jgi:choline dehydrogenase-like flavoprotein
MGFPASSMPNPTQEVLAVRPALQYSNVTLLTNAHVVKLNTNPTGTAITEVVVNRSGQTETFRGSIVVVSCGAANSAKLLLISGNDKHPNGLANGSDNVGRNYMYHNSQAVLAISKEPNPTKYQKTLGLNDFYFGMEGFEFPMGNIQMVGKSQGPMYKGEKPLEAGVAPGWTLDHLAVHAVDFWLSTEDLPKADNRITVDGQGTITLSYTPANQVPKQKLYEKLKSMLNSLGMHDHLIPRNLYMKNEIGIGGVAHQAGTCRFGTDPKSSVLDTNCKAHELDNLYVVDTSFFPSIGAVNPALTAMANALRVGDHLIARIK